VRWLAVSGGRVALRGARGELGLWGRTTWRLTELPASAGPVSTHASCPVAGLLLFLREGLLMAQVFDDRSQLRGDATPIAADVGNIGTYGWFSASNTGAPSGTLTLVTPVFISTNVAGSEIVPAFATSAARTSSRCSFPLSTLT